MIEAAGLPARAAEEARRRVQQVLLLQLPTGPGLEIRRVAPNQPTMTANVSSVMQHGASRDIAVMAQGEFMSRAN
ncbi:MAG: hypothetical protein U0263_32630 [Polyangiaceae bacterium]